MSIGDEGSSVSWTMEVVDQLLIISMTVSPGFIFVLLRLRTQDGVWLLSRLNECEESLLDILLEVLVELDCVSPLVEDCLLVGPLDVGIDWVAVCSEVEWGELDVLGLELGSLGVFLLDLSLL